MSRVLVVDDDPDLVKVASKVLQKAGHEVVSASNGAQALKTMREKAPDLVLLDIVMSYVLDGLDVRREMVDDPALRGIPVIMMTSVTAVRMRDMVPTDEDVPVDHFLTKPVNPDKLLECVGQALGQ